MYACPRNNTYFVSINLSFEDSYLSFLSANGVIKGSLTGISVGVGISSMQKVWRSLQAFGDIAFAYSFSNILIEIQVSP